MHEFEVKSRICGETGRFLNRFKSEHKKHRAKTKRFQNRCPIRLLQLSAAGEVFCVYCRDTACRVRQLCQGEIPLKTFHRNVFKIRIQQMGHRAERSCSLRPRKAVAFLTHLLRVPRSMGTGISPSADGDLEGTCPLRTPRQLCSVGSALQSNPSEKFSVFPKNPCLTGLAFFSNILYNNVYTESTTGSYFRKDFAT